MASDLHTHTNFSDGFFSPSDLIAKARDAGIKHLAITDHDTVDGVASLGKIEGLHLIAGVEITAHHPNPKYELHIIGLNVDISNNTFKSKLNEFVRQRQERVNKILAKLRELGFAINLQDIYEAVGHPQTIVRIHIARALAHKNYFSKTNEAYEKLLRNGQPAYVPLTHPSADEAISLIHQAGGLAILAHPKLARDDELVEKVATKIDGIEVYYPRHSWMDEQRYLALARKYNLKISGGSDFHGTPGDKKHPNKLGAFTVEDRIVEEWL